MEPPSPIHHRLPLAEPGRGRLGGGGLTQGLPPSWARRHGHSKGVGQALLLGPEGQGQGGQGAGWGSL